MLKKNNLLTVLSASILLISCSTTKRLGPYNANRVSPNSGLVDVTGFNGKRGNSYTKKYIPLRASGRLAVMEFRAKGVSRLIASNVSEMIRNELINIGAYTMIERSQMNQILKEQGFQQTGCTDVECAVKVGRLLSANKILIGTVMKMGRSFVISGRVVDVERGVGEAAANERTRSREDIYDAVVRFIRKLTGY